LPSGFQLGLGRVLRLTAHTGFSPATALLDAAASGYFASATLWCEICGHCSTGFLPCQEEKMEKQSENRETIAEQFIFLKVIDFALKG